MSQSSFHGSGSRELSAITLEALSGHGDPGRFGRMFPSLPPLLIEDAPLERLAESMVDVEATNASGDNVAIPAGFTYLGQFVDHDLTLDTTPLALQSADPTATENFRTPALDLDSLYLGGPGISPHLYERGTQPPYGPTNRFLVGSTEPSPDQGLPDPLPFDLPRNHVGRALIGDERNDENLAVAQTHLLFLKFHNAVVDFLEEERPDLGGAAQFEEAQRLVRWHYQWIVLFDFVERLTEPGVVERILRQGRRFYRFKTTPYIPAEFAGAAYRLGHSMVRQVYDWNRVFREGGEIVPANFALLFGFTGKSGAIVGDLVDDSATAPTPSIPGGKLRTLPANWIVDWRRLFELDLPAGEINASRLIDPLLAAELLRLPGLSGRDAMLPFRNLARGVRLGLPSGQAIAAWTSSDVLTPGEIATGTDGEVAAQEGLTEATPLWYYVLKEAQVRHGGVRLGPVGSLLVAETFVGIVQGDATSFLSRPDWAPELPAEAPGHFTMADLIRFVDARLPGEQINPVGGV